MAEGPRDVLVSRNSATYKRTHLKLESRAYHVALFADGQTDGQTHDDGMYRT